jgi:hypothetical protein
VNCDDVEFVPSASKVKLKPVIAAAEKGETAMSPVIADCGTVEMPVFVRIL